MTTTAPAALDPTFDPGTAPQQDPNVQAWRGILAIEGEATSDGRIFDRAVWRVLPLPLLWQVENLSGHDGAVIVGRIDRIVRRGNEIWGFGVFDLGSEVGREVVRLIEGQFLRGVSIDAAVADGEVTVQEDGSTRFSQVEIGAATMVAFPAFRDAEIELSDAPIEGAEEVVEAAEAIAASAVIAPPAAWFEDPGLDRRYGLHVDPADERGLMRIWGHLYGWGECHQGSPAGRCIQVPRGGSYKHIVSIDGRGVLCSDGSFAQTGPIFLNADHARLSGLSWIQAKDHYAHTGLAVADVRCGEDAHGIWVAGYVRPGIADELVSTLRASGPSGDWRRIGGHLELVAILAVNNQGFPALAASYAGGQVEALVASSSFTEEGGCSCGTSQNAQVAAMLAQMAGIEAAVRELLAPVHAARDLELAALDREMGCDLESVLARLDAEMAL